MMNKKNLDFDITGLLCQFSKFRPYNKIYINKLNVIYVNNTNHVSIPFKYLDVNRAFFGSNANFLKEIIHLKIKHDVKDVYFEFDGYNDSFLQLPIINEACESEYFSTIENDCFIKSIINKYKNKEHVFFDNINRFIYLLDIKKAFYLLQYIRCKEIVSIEMLKEMLDVYIEKLLLDKNFIEYNNLRYLRASVLNLFSLENVDISC
ncbi:hypothetical protein ACWL47_003998 [Yersinia enterocolitica]